MDFFWVISAGIAGVHAEVSGSLEGRSVTAVEVDKNPAARRDWEPALARFPYGELLLHRFDPKTGSFSETREVKFVPSSTVTLKPDDDWAVRGPGLVFSSQQGASSSVWLMKLPH